MSDLRDAARQALGALFGKLIRSRRADRKLAELETVNQELLEALKTITSMCESVGDFSNGVTDSTGTIDEGAILAIGVIQDARAAIAKTEGKHD